MRTPRCSVLALAALGAMLSGTACKPQPASDSSVQSLDNLASNDGRKATNQCAGPYTTASQNAALKSLVLKQTRFPAAAKADVEAALSSIPNGLKEMFYGFGHEIEFAVDARARCAGKKAVSGTDEVPLGCAKGSAVTSGNETSEKITLLISAAPQDIRHGTLLAFASVVGQLLPHVQFEKGVPHLRADEDVKLAAYRRELAVQVAHDEFAAGRTGFERFKALLPAASEFRAASTSLAVRESLFDDFAAENEGAARSFELLVLENTIDSFYCSETARETARRLYPTAIATFEQQLHPEVDEFAASPTAKLSLYEDCEAYLLPGRRQRCYNRAETGYSFPRLAGYRLDPEGSGAWVSPTSGLGWRCRGDYVYASDPYNGGGYTYYYGLTESTAR